MMRTKLRIAFGYDYSVAKVIREMLEIDPDVCLHFDTLSKDTFLDIDGNLHAMINLGMFGHTRTRTHANGEEYILSRMYEDAMHPLDWDSKISFVVSGGISQTHARRVLANLVARSKFTDRYSVTLPLMNHDGTVYFVIRFSMVPRDTMVELGEYLKHHGFVTSYTIE